MSSSPPGSPRSGSDVANTPGAANSSPAPMSSPPASPAPSNVNTPQQQYGSDGLSSPLSFGSVLGTPGAPGTPGTPGIPRSPLPRSDLGTGTGRPHVSPGGRPLGSDAGSTNGTENQQKTVIWGTTVNVQETVDALHRFFEDYTEPDSDEPLYPRLLAQLSVDEEYSLNLDCGHLHRKDRKLYEQLTRYPQEVVPLCDIVIQDLFAKLFPQVQQKKRITVRPFGLTKVHHMRDLDPVDIDQLVAIQGMVVRTSNVIPDLKMAHFQCSVCNATQDVFIDRGQIAEPQKCTNPSCGAVRSMQIIHNCCQFADKQSVRVQESPENIPEGETPQTVSMLCWDDLVDVSRPGDRVEMTGIYRAQPVRPNPRQRTVKAIYKTYIDVIHVAKKEKGRLNTDQPGEGEQDEHTTSFREAHDLQAEVDARENKLKELSRDPEIYSKLANALAPSIWELEDVKKGVLCQLFGATSKQLSDQEAGGARYRGEINVLMVGDPGTSKSQLLQYVHKAAPRGIYTSGKGSSAVGLTAYVTRDPETNDFVLESGALVLSDRGICCIDEFDKMPEMTRSVLHEAMEQQTVSVAKAGIVCSLNSRCSILAAANPIESKYNPSMTVVENIDLSPTLLSRFDLIYLILDKPNERSDRQLARHLVSLYHAEVNLSTTSAIDRATLIQYISYARQNIHPVISDDALHDLIENYVDMRKMGAGNKTITATPRQLESMIRLAEAHARVRLSKSVDRVDVTEALRLMKVATQQAATDPTTGTIDMDLITTGRSANARQLLEQLAQATKDMLANLSGSRTISIPELLKRINDDSTIEVPVNQLRDALGLLEMEGFISLSKNQQVRVR